MTSPMLAAASHGANLAQIRLPHADGVRARVRLLGWPAVDTSAPQHGPARPATLALVAFLVLRREGASRDELLEALWPDADPRLSEQRLWKSLAETRRLLGTVLLRERDRYRLERQSLWIDADELERLLAAADDARRNQAELHLLEHASELVRGEPLAGLDYLWAQGEARRLRGTLVELYARLARLRLAAGRARDTLTACERGLALDALDEELWRLAMEAEAAIGARSSIAARYQTLCALVGDRLGLDPERQTRDLYRQLLGQR